MSDGEFIVLEGIDGSGTTTQVERLVARMKSENRPAIATREPTTGPVGGVVRMALTHRLVSPGPYGPSAPGWQMMALLFAADRLDHLQTEVLPNLRDGISVVSDRYDLSSLAYQSATAENERADEVLTWLRALNRFARRPDLTVVLDVPHLVADDRRRRRSQAVELYEVNSLQERLAAAYRTAETLVPGDRVVHINGEGSVDAVSERVYEAIRSIGAESAT